MENQNQNRGQGQQTINIQVPSADNIASRRPLIPASFTFAIILFFFTFCDFKCGGQKIFSVTGINLVTGTELKDHDMFTGRETKGKEIPASIWAIFAFGAAIVGLGAFLIKEKREALIGTGAGAIGFGSLLILQFVIKSTIDKEARGQLEADLQFPYWGALIAFAVAGIISYLRLQKTHNFVVRVSPPTTTTPTAENISQPTIISTPQTSNFDIGEWATKNKRQVTFGTSGILAILILLFVLNKTIWSVEHKAQKFIDSGLYEQARMILDNEIQKSPDNENLYFLYGKYYLATDNFSNATQSFEQAARINSSIGSKIADAYFHEAEKSIKANNVDRANNFFSLCIKYNPNKKDKAVKELVNAIEENLKQNNTSAAYSYAQTAINLDPSSSKTISKKSFDIAKSLTSSSQNANNIIALGEFSNNYNNSLQNEWGSLLKSFLDNNSKSIDMFSLANFCQRAAQWNSSLKDEMSNLVLSQAKEELKKPEFDVNAIQSLLSSATSINNTLKPEASSLIWEKLSSNLSDLKSLGQSRFLSLYGLFESFGISSDISNSNNYQLVFALKNFVDGDKERAISIFKALSENKNSTIGKIASNVLSPPPIGTRNFSFEKFQFKGTRNNWGSKNGILINLTSAEISSFEITLTFVIENLNYNDMLIYAPQLHSNGWSTPTKPLQIQDDNGKTFYAIGGFNGGNQKKFNNYIKQIDFSPQERATLKVKFPMVSEGATSLKFISPTYNGWQYGWHWSNIKIKDGPFD